MYPASMSADIVIPANVTTSKRAQADLLNELGAVELQDFRSAMKAWSVDDLTAAGAGLIQFYSKLDETKTDVLKALAKVVVALRAHYRTPEGDVDWGGRSWDYRQTASAMYDAAGIPPDSESNIQASLRYHVGNLLREVAPPKQLAAVGLLAKSPKARMNDVRTATTALLATIEEPPGGRRATPAEVASRNVTALFVLVDTLEASAALWDGLSLRLAEEYAERLDEIDAKLSTVRGQLRSAMMAKTDT